MITDVFIGGMIEILRALFFGLPSWEPDWDGVSDGAATVVESAAWLNGYFPVATLGLALVIVWGYRLALIAYSGVRELWDALPFT